MSGIFDFEELMADMLNISDATREDDNAVIDAFETQFDLDYHEAHLFAKALLDHVVPIEAGFSGNTYHAFISKKRPVMLMKKATTGAEQ